MTLTQLYADIRAILNRPSTDAVVTDALLLALVNDEYIRFAEDARCFTRRAILAPVVNARATGTVTIAAGNVSAGETVTVNGLAYTFRDTVSTTARDILIGVTNEASAENLAAAISGLGGGGVTYGSATIANPYVTATASAGVVTLTAKLYGTEANAYTLATTAANVTLSDSVLAGGANGTTYAKPDDAGEVLAVTVNDAEIEGATEASLDAIFGASWRNAAAATPMYWYGDYTGKIGLYPPPDGSATVVVKYIAVPSAVTGGIALLATGTDVPAFPARFHRALSYAVVLRLLTGALAEEVDGTQSRVAFAQAEYDNLLSAFKASMVVV